MSNNQEKARIAREFNKKVGSLIITAVRLSSTIEEKLLVQTIKDKIMAINSCNEIGMIEISAEKLMNVGELILAKNSEGLLKLGKDNEDDNIQRMIKIIIGAKARLRPEEEDRIFDVLHSILLDSISFIECS